MSRAISITDDVIREVYELARTGISKALIVQAIPISNSSWYRCRSFGIKHKDLTKAQVNKLPNIKKKYWELWDAYRRGRQEFIRDGFKHFSEIEDNRIRWQFFKSAIPELQEKPRFNKYDLFEYLMADFGPETADKVMEILMGAEENE